MRVASDTGPLHSLALIEAIEILPALFGGLVIPETVVEDLSHPEAPVAVRDWSVDRSLDRLDPGERQTILLARSTGPTSCSWTIALAAVSRRRPV